eukprot:1017764-Rhodomonas_salina.4
MGWDYHEVARIEAAPEVGALPSHSDVQMGLIVREQTVEKVKYLASSALVLLQVVVFCIRVASAGLLTGFVC